MDVSEDERYVIERIREVVRTIGYGKIEVIVQDKVITQVTWQKSALRDAIKRAIPTVQI